MYLANLGSHKLPSMCCDKQLIVLGDFPPNGARSVLDVLPGNKEQ